MHGYRDHCMRTAYPPGPNPCPYLTEFQCPYYIYRQKAEEYPAQFAKAPSTPPPNTIPSMPSTAAHGAAPINTREILPCVFKFTYLWLKNGEAYWTYITFIGPRSISGWMYRNGSWIQFGLNLDQIRVFSCT